MFRILLSNDDGVHAPGLKILAETLSSLAEIDVVAPDRDKSGISNSLTLNRPVRALQMSNGFLSVDGTPTDCVHLAITGLLAHDPQMVVSGINHGANLGDDVLYSGTVAAAMEGRFLGYPAIAVSLVTEGRMPHFATAARVVKELIIYAKDHPLSNDTILNVNVPDLPYEELQGIEVTRCGYRHRAEPVVKTTDPRGRTIYWVGPAGAEQDAGPGTDFYAIKNKKVSLTPLKFDMTAYDRIPGTKDWLGSFSSSLAKK